MSEARMSREDEIKAMVNERYRQIFHCTWNEAIQIVTEIRDTAIDLLTENARLRAEIEELRKR